MKTINVAKRTGPNSWTKKTYRILEGKDWAGIAVAALVVGYVLIRSIAG